MTRPTNLLNDYAFMEVYGFGDEKSNQALIGLLTTFLKRKVIDVRIKNPELVACDSKEEEPVLDILVTFEDGDTANVVMLASNTDEWLISRLEYHVAQIHSSQQIEYEEFYRLKKTIGLAFVNGILFEKNKDRYYHVMKLANQNNKSTDEFLVELIIVELPKLKSMDIKNMTSMERYMYYLNHCQDGSDDCTIKLILDNEEAVRMAEERVKDIDDDRWNYLNSILEK